MLGEPRNEPFHKKRHVAGGGELVRVGQPGCVLEDGIMPAGSGRRSSANRSSVASSPSATTVPRHWRNANQGAECSPPPRCSLRSTMQPGWRLHCRALRNRRSLLRESAKPPKQSPPIRKPRSSIPNKLRTAHEIFGLTLAKIGDFTAAAAALKMPSLSSRQSAASRLSFAPWLSLAQVAEESQPQGSRSPRTEKPAN